MVQQSTAEEQHNTTNNHIPLKDQMEIQQQQQQQYNNNNATYTSNDYILGIDIGTQGLSVVLVVEQHDNNDDAVVIATGESSYSFVVQKDDDDNNNNDTTNYFEQYCNDWEMALQKAMEQLRIEFCNKYGGKEDIITFDNNNIIAIGIAGQMHGEVLLDDNGVPLSSVRLWCDGRNNNESIELTKLFHCKIPKRCTVARFLWTIRNQPDKAKLVRHITTPAGYLSYKLTGQYNLGIGDASGMFPIDPITHNEYDTKLLSLFDQFVDNTDIPPLQTLLPTIRQAGDDGGILTKDGAKLLGISINPNSPTIYVAPAEGDQVAALAGSFIGKAGSISCCFGTSVCANVIGDHPFTGISAPIDHFYTADAKLINMVWLRNGTTFLNTIIHSYGSMIQSDDDDDIVSLSFEHIMPLLLQAPIDCGGIITLPFINDEPGLNVVRGKTALIVGISETNATVGNITKAALLSTIFNLKLGCTVLDEQGYPRTEIILTGGLTKTPACGQIIADVFNTPVKVLSNADEGSSWGAAVLAKYRYMKATDVNYNGTWETFLESFDTTTRSIKFIPNPDNVQQYNTIFERYKKLIQLESQLEYIMTS